MTSSTGKSPVMVSATIILKPKKAADEELKQIDLNNPPPKKKKMMQTSTRVEEESSLKNSKASVGMR